MMKNDILYILKMKSFNILNKVLCSFMHIYILVYSKIMGMNYMRLRFELVISIFISALIAGLFGFSILNKSTLGGGGGESSWVQVVYSVVQLFLFNADSEAINHNIWLEWSAFFAMLFILITATTILSKMFTGAQLAGLRIVRALKGRRHIVVCGLGRLGRKIAKDARNKGFNVVAIERDPNIFMSFPCRDLGVIAVLGDAVDPDILRVAQASRADKVFIVTGEDATNLAVAEQIKTDRFEPEKRSISILRYIRGLHPAHEERSGEAQPRCYVHCNEAEHGRLLDGSPYATSFNVDDRVALSLVRDKISMYNPTKDQVVHIFLLGFSAMGQAIALWVARLGHFGNCRRLRITIIDQGIEEKREIFLSSYPAFCTNEGNLNLENYPALSEIDEWGGRVSQKDKGTISPSEVGVRAVEYVCNAEFISVPIIEALSVHNLVKRRVSENVLPICIVALDNEALGFASASRLQMERNRYGDGQLPIYLWLPRLESLGRMIPEEWNIFVFGLSGEFGWDQAVRDVEEEAKKVHNAYLKHLSANSPKVLPTPKWDSLSEAMRESNRQQHDHTAFKLVAANWEWVPAGEVKADLHDIDGVTNRLAEMEHNRWMAERLLGGWQYGRRGGNSRATLIPFSDLSEEDKAFDLAFVRSLPARMLAAGRPIKPIVR